MLQGGAGQTLDVIFDNEANGLTAFLPFFLLLKLSLA
jgi:hypothetical protein